MCGPSHRSARWTALPDFAVMELPLALRRRLRRFAAGAVAAFVHELVELGAILGKAQALQELLEFALFIFEPAQGFGAVIVEGAIATGSRAKPIAAALELRHL